jgi:GTP-binding protein EngB required for normal cell division
MEERFSRLAALENRGAGARRTLDAVARGSLPELPPEPQTKDFYLFGVLGAKNVGKSSLVASILGLEHAAEEGRELGAGTRKPRIFACPELMPRVRDAFAAAGVETEVAAHQGLVAGLEKVAFVDLPDIESRFEDHLPQVMAVNGEIDGLVVVRTSESSFDHTFMEKLKQFRRPQMDLYLVMNKFDDWVAARGSEEEARAVCTEHLAEVLRGLDLSTEDVYMTDARPAEIREGGGYDLSRLAAELLQDKSSEELLRAKLRAWVFQLRLWTEAIRSGGDLLRGRATLAGLLQRCGQALRELSPQKSATHALLPGRSERLLLSETEAVEAPSEGLAQVVPLATQEGFARFVERRLVSSRQVEQAESRLLRRVFHHRVERLPFARVLAAPLFVFGEVLDGLLGRTGGMRTSPYLEGTDQESLEAVAGLFESINESLELERAALYDHFQGVPEGRILSPEEGGRLLQGVLHGCLKQREEAVCAQVHLPWMPYRWLMWFPVLWFLLLRPLTRLYLARQAAWSWGLLVAGVPVVLLEITTPSVLISAVVTLLLVYAAVLFREYHWAFRAVHELDRLEAAGLEWAGGVTEDLYREIFGRVIPERFRRLGQCLEDGAEQLDGVDQGLRDIDREAVADAERQLREEGGLN